MGRVTLTVVRLVGLTLIGTAIYTAISSLGARFHAYQQPPSNP